MNDNQIALIAELANALAAKASVEAVMTAIQPPMLPKDYAIKHFVLEDGSGESSRLLFTRIYDNLAVGDRVSLRTRFVLGRSTGSRLRIAAIEANVPLFGHEIRYVEFDGNEDSAELALVAVHVKDSLRRTKCRVNEVGELVAAEDGRTVTRLAIPDYNYL